MSKVEQIEAEIEKLSPQELKEIREWLEDFAEDRLSFTEQFEADIRQSEHEMNLGLRPRTRKP